MQYMIYEIITKTIKQSTLLTKPPTSCKYFKEPSIISKYTYIVKVYIREVHEMIG